MSLPSRFRVLSRAFHTTRTLRAGSPPWGSQINEPGGRLFGERILKPGERRKLYDWEIIYVGTLGIATLMLVVGLNSRPDTTAESWAREQARIRLGEVEPSSTK